MIAAAVRWLCGFFAKPPVPPAAPRVSAGIAALLELSERAHRPAAGCLCAWCQTARSGPHLRIRAETFEALQFGALLVGLGSQQCVEVGNTFVSPAGVGNIWFLAVSDPLYEQVVRPALAAHLSAPKDVRP
jgi:hypothetical protein